MTDNGLSARLRTHHPTLAILAIGIAMCSCEPADDRAARHPADNADEHRRVTVTDCELRPGAEPVVKPNAESRDFIRMSGCEMIFWNSGESPHPTPETHR
jgi:hypothetical protein